MAGGLQAPSKEEEEAEKVQTSRNVVFVLENANLEVAKVGKVIKGQAFEFLLWIMAEINAMHVQKATYDGE